MKPIELFLNRVIHGDCITVMQAMPSASVDLVITDLPYLVNYRARDGRQCLNDDNSAWLRPAFEELRRVLKPDRFCVCFYGWPWIESFMATWKESGFRPVSHLVWLKSYCSRKGYTQSFHEVGFLLTIGKPPKPALPPSDVLPWEYTGNEFHPNQKPVIGLAPLIEAFSKAGEIVLDPFAGSGSTGLAAKASNRQFILIEKSWQHYRTARQRLSD